MTTTSNNSTPTNQQASLTVHFVDTNQFGMPIADLYLGERRLLATVHPASVVAAMYAMDIEELTVVTKAGNFTGEFDFDRPRELGWSLDLYDSRYRAFPELYQFRHLAPTGEYQRTLELFELFACEMWSTPHNDAHEHLQVAHHYLPKELIKRPLTTSAPEAWQAMANEYAWSIHFPRV